MTAIPVRSLVERFYHEVWNRADEGVAREILGPHFQFRASLGPRTTGPEGFIAYMRSIHAALDEYTCVIEDIIENGPQAAARMRFGGIHRGVLFGIPATGNAVMWSGAAFFTSDGRQIVDLWVLGDVDGLKQQLGAAHTAPFAG